MGKVACYCLVLMVSNAQNTSILNISKLGRAMISFLNAPSIHPYSVITRFEARLTAPILFKQPFRFVHNLHGVALTV